MVKLTGPGLGLEASGSLADQVTFSNWKGKAFLKRKPRPKQPDTANQLAMRAIMRFLAPRWNELTAAQQTTWDAVAATTDIAPSHAFNAYNLDRWRRRLPPSKKYPATEENELGYYETVIATGGVRHVDLELYKTLAVEDNWTILVFHSLTSPATPIWNNLVHVEKCDDLERHFWTHTPLPTGTHYYRVDGATDDGYADFGLPDLDSALVT